MSKLVVLVGDLARGFEFVGPFDDAKQVETWCAQEGIEMDYIKVSLLTEPVIEPDTATYQYLIRETVEHDRGVTEFYIGSFEYKIDATAWMRDVCTRRCELIKVET